MLQIPVQDLRRIASALEALKGLAVRDAHLRPDLRQLKIELEDETVLVIAAALDDAGHPHLEIDVVRVPEESLSHQLEVGFDAR